MAPSTVRALTLMAQRTGATVCALFLVLVSSTAVGAVPQRMLLPTQSFTVPPGGSSDATSYCLDQYAKSPSIGSRFEAASAALGDISVSVPGKGTHTLQAALQNKIVEVVGNGGYDTVTFRNLTNESPITVSIKRNSVVVPPDNASTDDIARLPAFGSPGQPALDQEVIWDTRDQLAAKELGQLPTAVSNAASAERFELTHDGILAIRNWTTKRNNTSTEKTFVLQRSQPPYSDRRQPLYVLYKPNGQILAYEGNGNLEHAVAEIKKSISTQPARLVLIGDGRDVDFDAARLTMEAAAGGGGKGPDVPPILGFESPSGPEPPGGGRLYRGGAWAGLAISRSEQRLSATQPVFRRGSVTVYSKTEQLLGRMAAAIRRVTRREQLAEAPKEELITRLRESIQSQVALAMEEDPTLKSREGQTPAADFSIDKTTVHQKFTNLPPTVLPESLQRVAHEH